MPMPVIQRFARRVSHWRDRLASGMPMRLADVEHVARVKFGVGKFGTRGR